MKWAIPIFKEYRCRNGSNRLSKKKKERKQPNVETMVLTVILIVTRDLKKKLFLNQAETMVCHRFKLTPLHKSNSTVIILLFNKEFW